MSDTPGPTRARRVSEARRAAEQRYNVSEPGRARKRRYGQTEKGREANRRYKASDKGQAMETARAAERGAYWRAYRALERQDRAAYLEGLFAPAPDKRVRVGGVSRLVVLSDLQIPFEDPAAVEQALKVIDHVKPDCVVLNGDVVDCYRESAFLQDFRIAETVTDEQHRRVRILMDILRHIPQKIWLGGNHEERWWRTIKQERQHGGHSAVVQNLLAVIRAEAKDDPDKRLNMDDPVNSFARIFDCKAYGFVFYPYSHRLYFALDNLVITHGKYVSRHSGYSAKRTYEWLGRSCIVGHTHRMGTYRVTLDGREHGAWENGCLCQLEPEYDDSPNWQQGFSVVAIDGPEFHVVQVPIIRRNGRPVAVYSGLGLEGTSGHN